MGKSKTKSISFKEKYSEEYKFLVSQDNPSQFVCDLIRKHLHGEDDFESRVKDIIAKYLINQSVISSKPVSSIQPISKTKSKIDEIEDPW